MSERQNFVEAWLDAAEVEISDAMANVTESLKPLAEKMMQAATEKAQADVALEMTRLRNQTARAHMEERRYNELYHELKYRQQRRRVAKLQASADRLTKYLRVIEKSCTALEQRMKAGLREPVPAPPGYAPPSHVVGAVLCDGIQGDDYVVYALVDSRDSECVRYVGITNAPRQRYKQHMRSITRVAGWTAEVVGAGGKVVMLALEVGLDSAGAADREAHWIHHYRARGMADLNSTIPRLRVA